MKFAAILDDFFKTYFQPKMGVRFFVGFSCGVPFLLRLSVLDLWLKDVGVSNAAIGLFTLLHWPFLLKFLWAPFIEKTDFPLLSKFFGRRRGWAIASQIFLFLGLCGMATSSPQDHVFQLMFFTSLVAFADGCQDISLYAYQIDCAKKKTYGAIAGVFIFGYKIGMFFSKSITLYLAHYFGWNAAYGAMAFSVFLCTIFVLCIKEPKLAHTKEIEKIQKLVKNFEEECVEKNSLTHLIKSRIYECLICPFKIFMQQKNWRLILFVILSYRVGDRIAQKMAKLFYVDLGFSMLDIANVVQVFGTTSTILGGVIGGYFTKQLGINRAMFYTGSVHAISCFAYVALSYIGHNISALYATVFIENITSGATATVFVAFLYSLCNKTYAATQYSLFWACYEFIGMIFRTLSGTMADALGWQNFFIMIPFIFIPALCALHILMRPDRCSHILKNT